MLDIEALVTYVWRGTNEEEEEMGTHPFTPHIMPTLTWSTLPEGSRERHAALYARLEELHLAERCVLLRYDGPILERDAIRGCIARASDGEIEDINRKLVIPFLLPFCDHPTVAAFTERVVRSYVHFLELRNQGDGWFGLLHGEVQQHLPELAADLAFLHVKWCGEKRGR